MKHYNKERLQEDERDEVCNQKAQIKISTIAIQGKPTTLPQGSRGDQT